MISLAVKYRPKNWEDITEQLEVKTILNNQIMSNEVKHAYLFTGPAGCGKTTAARIFANEINNGIGNPIELDAASNNGVDDIRNVIEEAKTKPLEGEYKTFIIDECHMITPPGWNAFLKTLEEPPKTAIFIMCTTNPEKIPNTILSRAQRYNFQKISQQGIWGRLQYILLRENEGTDYYYDKEALEYIAKIADGGMRDAITLMDKCLSYNPELTIENVVKALGVADYDTMFSLCGVIFDINTAKTVEIINSVYNSGIDLKLFIRSFYELILDICIYNCTTSLSQTKLPNIYKEELDTYSDWEYSVCMKLLDMLVQLNYQLRYEQNPRAFILAKFILFLTEVSNDRSN